jgi:hypothetical protein
MNEINNEKQSGMDAAAGNKTTVQANNDNEENSRRSERGKRPVLIPIVILAVIVFLVLLVGVVWIAASRKVETIETNIHTLVKEILPVSEYVCLVYNYQSVNKRTYNDGSWLTEANMLIVIDGTIKLGFDCSEIQAEEKQSQLILKMPPIKIISHEQYPENATAYDLKGGWFPRKITPQETLNLLGDSKKEHEEKVSEKEELYAQARSSAEELFRPLLELNPAVKEKYSVIFQW